jgi:RNA polymerase sigma-70 factor (ECF subfamily)
VSDLAVTDRSATGTATGTAADAAVDRGIDTGIDTAELNRELERYRSQLTGYCYRMLGSAFDAEDAVQETMVRAWRNLDRFEGRSALRSWLYRIATNVCLDNLRGRQRRAMPMDMSPAVPATTPPGRQLSEATWLTPIPDAMITPEDADPAERAVAQDSVRLAFVAALQHLPPRQRAVLILREVLCWQAAEVAELLETSVASVNSLLQRARAGLSASERLDDAGGGTLSAEDEDLLARYTQAFEAYDMKALVALLHEDASQSMPPYEMWLSGRDQIVAWFTGHGIGCQGSRTIPTVANGMPAFAQYRVSQSGSGYEAWGLHVLVVSEGRVAHFDVFLDTRLFELFGLPLTLD